MRSCLTCDCATRKRNEVVLVPPTNTIPVWSAPGRGCRLSHLRLSSFSRRGTSCSRVFGTEATEKPLNFQMRLPWGQPTRHRAARTAAGRRWHTVGFPLRTAWRAILVSTTLHISGLNDAACLLATPGFVRPLTGRHAGSLLTGWRGVSQGGLEP